MRVYVAARFSERQYVKSFMLKVMTMRHRQSEPIEFVNTWQDRNPLEDIQALNLKEEAIRDLFEIDRAECVIVLTENAQMAPGGMHFETGYAFALRKKIVVIGARVHAFHYLGGIVHFPSVQAFLASDFEATFNGRV